MKKTELTVQAYLNGIPADRKPYFDKLRKTIIDNLPKGYVEAINYGMIGYVVPHKLYPGGYHVKPELPLPFINIANQKGFLGLYHMGIYAIPDLQEWFTTEYKATCKYKLDMGKSCVRLKRLDDIPYELIAELTQKVSVSDWISAYEAVVKPK